MSGERSLVRAYVLGFVAGSGITLGLLSLLGWLS